jgi:serine phosphatase RsbU (regulator of sigma subunit)
MFKAFRKTNRLQKKVCFLLFFLCLIKNSRSQTGNYFITNFTPANYSSTDQNRGIVQDRYNIIYSANLSGVLNYDGVYWRLIPMANESAAISIDVDKKGQIFVGGQNELGYLKKHTDGTLKYQSLLNFIPEKDRDFSIIWSTLCSKNKVYFGSNESLIIYDYKKTQVIKAPVDSLFHTFFKVADLLLVRQFGVGFKVYINNNLEFINSSKILADVKVRFILPKENDEYWVGTENGMYTMKLNIKNPTKSIISKTPHIIDEWIQTNQINCGIKLSNGNYVFGSQKKGIIHVDKYLNIIKSITYKNGLQDEFVAGAYEDVSGNIWLSLNKGISHIEINSPITYWTKLDGIKGTIETAFKFDKKLFIGTIKGLDIYNKDENKFEETPVTTSVWDLCKIKNKLLIATEGVYIYENHKYNYALECGLVYKLLADKMDSTIVYIGGESFFMIGKLKGNFINIIKTFEVKGDIRSIFQKNNVVYFSINGWGIDALNTKNYTIKHYTEKDGLPNLQDNTIFEYNQQTLIGTYNGIYTFNEKSKNKFTRENKYNCFPNDYQFSKTTPIFQDIFFQGTGNSDNIAKVDEISSLKFENNKLIEDKKFLRRIRDVNAKHFHLNDSLVYISTNDGLYCYDLTYHKKPQPYITIINSLHSPKDTIINDVFENINENYKFNYSENELQFYLAAPNFSNKNELLFAYYLEGKNITYGKWTKNNIASFYNLIEGHYIFHAKSKDVLGKEGKEISFSFSILPPWYRTAWAYTSYVLVFVVIIWLIVKLNTKRLRDKNIKLENTITERTKTIIEQKVEIEHKNQEIVDSINYAQRIQKSLLASDNLLDENLKNYFVFFNPKDIVSGDFYWGAELSEKEFALVTADSTGHGVPGAIMSMLNISCLNEAVEGQKLKQPSEILNYTRSKIIKHLSNDGSASGGKDGMDCSLITFDFEKNLITYTAANNPIWIVRENTMIELKPDKMPVGKHDRDSESFSQHEFNVQKNDTIYALTDGMPDQFGGSKGKKYMYKQLKELLISISQLPMIDQKEKLQIEFNNWKGDLEQVDDVLIIGVKV